MTICIKIIYLCQSHFAKLHEENKHVSRILMITENVGNSLVLEFKQYIQTHTKQTITINNIVECWLEARRDFPNHAKNLSDVKFWADSKAIVDNTISAFTGTKIILIFWLIWLFYFQKEPAGAGSYLWWSLFVNYNFRNSSIVFFHDQVLIYITQSNCL